MTASKFSFSTSDPAPAPAPAPAPTPASSGVSSTHEPASSSPGTSEGAANPPVAGATPAVLSSSNPIPVAQGMVINTGASGAGRHAPGSALAHKKNLPQSIQDALVAQGALPAKAPPTPSSFPPRSDSTQSMASCHSAVVVPQTGSGSASANSTPAARPPRVLNPSVSTEPAARSGSPHAADGGDDGGPVPPSSPPPAGTASPVNPSGQPQADDSKADVRGSRGAPAATASNSTASNAPSSIPPESAPAPAPAPAAAAAAAPASHTASLAAPESKSLQAQVSEMKEKVASALGPAAAGNGTEPAQASDIAVSHEFYSESNLKENMHPLGGGGTGNSKSNEADGVAKVHSLPPALGRPDTEQFQVKEHLDDILKLPQMTKATSEAQWLPNADGTGYVVVFRIWDRGDIGMVLGLLTMRCGIGAVDPPLPQCGSVVVLPIEVGRPDRSTSDSLARRVAQQPGADVDVDAISARILVEPVVHAIRLGAQVSFDYVMLCIVASLLAGVGLASNNAVIIVASMLVSPIMGPILAVTFGALIFDWSLVFLGLKAELVGLLLCVASGFVQGIVLGQWAEHEMFEWPNMQQEDRGKVPGLYLGIAIAIPSGAGVALSVLGNNTSSLVGVAISASLLPPLVNAGMLWGHALFGELLYDVKVDSGEFMELGGISFALTVINIVIIFIVAGLMFVFKEAGPVPGKSALFRTTAAVRAANHLRRHRATLEEPPETMPLEALKEALRRYKQMTNGNYPPTATGSFGRTVTEQFASSLRMPKPDDIASDGPKRQRIFEVFPELAGEHSRNSSIQSPLPPTPMLTRRRRQTSTPIPDHRPNAFTALFQRSASQTDPVGM